MGVWEFQSPLVYHFFDKNLIISVKKPPEVSFFEKVLHIHCTFNHNYSTLEILKAEIKIQQLDNPICDLFEDLPTIHLVEV